MNEAMIGLFGSASYCDRGDRRTRVSRRGALIEAGAMCYVPWRHEDETQRFPYREHKQVKLFGSIDLADESAVKQLFDEVPSLWASINVAGGFAMAPVAKSRKSDLMHLIDMNLVSCFLCCSAAVN